MGKYNVAVLLCFFLFGNARSQDEVFYQPSPEISAVGGAGVALKTDDPSSFYYNPAQLGLWSQSNNFAVSFNPERAIQYEDNDPAYRTRNTIAALAYNFKDVFKGTDVSIGLGYLSYRQDNQGNAFFAVNNLFYNWNELYSTYHAYSIGLGIHSVIDFAMGFTYKDIHQDIDDVHPQFQSLMRKDFCGLKDFGILLNIPMHRLLPYADFALNQHAFSPFLNLSIGAAWDNVKAEKIINSNTERPEGIPYYDGVAIRTAHLGYDCNFGIDLKTRGTNFRLIECDLATESQTVLNSGVSPDNNIKYDGGLGDIDIGSNLIQRKVGPNVIIRSGFSCCIGNTIAFQTGRISEYNWITTSYSGFTIRTEGILRLIAAYSNSPTITFLAQHFDVKFSRENVGTYYENSEKPIEVIQILCKGFTFDGLKKMWGS